MDYLISLLEGVITFVSPCMLPMLPIYGLYFAAGESDKRKALFNSLGFVLGFTVVFVSLGAFAGTFGRLLADYGKWVNLAAGAIITVFGLNYLNIFSLPFFHGYRKIDYRPENRGFFPYTVMPVPVTYFIDREGYLKAYGEGMMSEDSLRSGIDMIYTEE